MKQQFKTGWTSPSVVTVYCQVPRERMEEVGRNREKQRAVSFFSKKFTHQISDLPTVIP